MFTKAGAEVYFNAEKWAGLLFAVAGVLAIVAALLVFFAIKTSFWKGAALPLLLIGLVEVAVGYTVYGRSDAQRQQIVYNMDMNPGAIAKAEVPRMQKVMQNFRLYRYMEIALLVLGLFLFLTLNTSADRQFWCGLGFGLALQAFAMLLADGFAERRGHWYHKGINSFIEQTQAGS
jgi:hypothetical protein